MVMGHDCQHGMLLVVFGMVRWHHACKFVAMQRLPAHQRMHQRHGSGKPHRGSYLCSSAPAAALCF